MAARQRRAPRGHRARNCRRRCRRVRRSSASAVRSGRCSPRSSCRSRMSAPMHIAADIGCHAFATFEPFSFGHSILGYGMSLASRAGVSPMMKRRMLSVMGDGGFWHNGLLTGVQSALFNGDDAVLVIFKNGYTSATGTQEMISTPDDDDKADASDKQQSLVHSQPHDREDADGHGRAVDAHRAHLSRRGNARSTFDEAFTTDFNGLKVIIAEGECQLERQRRVKPWIAQTAEGAEARGAREIRRRRGYVHGRPRLHPAVGLPDADVEGQSRSAAGRSGRHGHRWLRRLRPVRRECACGDAVPVVLSRRGDPEPEVARPRWRRACERRSLRCSSLRSDASASERR